MNRDARDACHSRGFAAHAPTTGAPHRRSQAKTRTSAADDRVSRPMIDTHCHLTDPRLRDQLDDVLARATGAGVTRVITVGTSPTDARAAVQIARAHPGIVSCAVGVHPNYVTEVAESDLSSLREIQADPSVVALGEMGLDYHYDTPRDRQRQFFEYQLSLATELDRPVVIHSRESVDDCVAMMRAFPAVRGVFHCFTDTLDAARAVLDAGHLIGFTGPVTYRKNDALREVVRFVPLDRLLVETDGPYLSPEPVRKHKVCEPAFVTHTAATVARVKGLTVDQVDRATTANAERLFRLAHETPPSPQIVSRPA